MPFRLDKTRLKQSFSAASTRYDGYAQLQRTVAHTLLSDFDTANLSGRWLDIGCGTGFLTGELLAISVCDQVIALDIALPMLQTTRNKYPDSVKAHYLCADAETLPFTEQSIDQVFSNLALQWCSPLGGVFNDIRRVLKPGGQLRFSTFGPDTLQELKAAWAVVDDYSHVNHFYSSEEISRFLQQAGFRHISMSRKVYQPCYASVQALMRELKGIGAHNVLAGRNKAVTGKSAMQAMIGAYQTASGDKPITATFEVITVTAMR